MAATLRVDRTLCAGAGLCQSMSPDLFGESRSGRPDGRERVLHDPGLIELAADIAACCPTGAVAVDDLPDTPTLLNTGSPAEHREHRGEKR